MDGKDRELEVDQIEDESISIQKIIEQNENVVRIDHALNKKTFKYLVGIGVVVSLSLIVHGIILILAPNIEKDKMPKATQPAKTPVPESKTVRVVGQTKEVEFTTSPIVVSQDHHEIRFSSESVLQHFYSPRSWRVQNNEMVGKDSPINDPHKHPTLLTYKTYFKSIKKVSIRGRIVPPSKTNFRFSVGQINVIFNWEMANENAYRNGEVLTKTQGHALKPGTWHTIVVHQDGTDAVVRVDDTEVYRTEAKLEGTVSLLPAMSKIAVSEIIIDGEAIPGRKVTGHSHSNFY